MKKNKRVIELILSSNIPIILKLSKSNQQQRHMRTTQQLLLTNQMIKTKVDSDWRRMLWWCHKLSPVMYDIVSTFLSIIVGEGGGRVKISQKIFSINREQYEKVYVSNRSNHYQSITIHLYVYNDAHTKASYLWKYRWFSGKKKKFIRILSLTFQTSLQFYKNKMR